MKNRRYCFNGGMEMFIRKQIDTEAGVKKMGNGICKKAGERPQGLVVQTYPFWI